MWVTAKGRSVVDRQGDVGLLDLVTEEIEEKSFDYPTIETLATSTDVKEVCRESMLPLWFGLKSSVTFRLDLGSVVEVDAQLALEK